MDTNNVLEFPPKEIILEVRCMACNELIKKPSDAHMLLVRHGINVHNTSDCINGLDDSLFDRMSDDTFWGIFGKTE